MTEETETMSTIGIEEFVTSFMSRAPQIFENSAEGNEAEVVSVVSAHQYACFAFVGLLEAG